MSETSTTTSKSYKIVHFIAYSFLLIVLGGSIFLNYQSFVKEDLGTFNYESFMKFVKPGSKLMEEPMQEPNGTVAVDCEMLKVSYETLEMEFEQAIEKLSQLQGDPTMPTRPQVVMKSKPRVLPAREAGKQGVKVKDFVQCDSMLQGSHEVSSKCRQKITNYVDKHRDALYFEIIGMIDPVEFKFFTLVKKNPSIFADMGISSDVLKRIQRYVDQGLAKQRAFEASWIIKLHTDKQAHTYNANYHITSKKGYKGVLVRAYK